MVPSNLSSEPGSSTPMETRSKTRALSTGAVIAIVVRAATVLILIMLIFLVYHWKKYIREAKVARKAASEKMDFSGGAQTPEMESSRLVFFDRKKQFELEDLLRASAEMLGKGSFGVAYKVVLDDGCIVAVP